MRQQARSPTDLVDRFAGPHPVDQGLAFCSPHGPDEQPQERINIRLKEILTVCRAGPEQF